MAVEAVIIDCGVGNAQSVYNMLLRAGFEAELTCEPEVIRSAARVIFPGVGSFDRAATAIGEIPSLKSAIEHAAINRQAPFLGICLGMQLLFEKSEEGLADGFGWIAGKSVRLLQSSGYPTPHMGWQNLDLTQSSKLFMSNGANRFYFAHSYEVIPDMTSTILATVNHGRNIVAAVQQENIFGVQFHPEKSHRFGMDLLKRFASMT